MYRLATVPGGRMERLARGNFQGTLVPHPAGSLALATVGSDAFAEVYLVALDGSGAMTRIAQAQAGAHAYTPDGHLALLTGRDGGAATLMAVDPEQPAGIKEVARFNEATADNASISASGKWAAVSLEINGEASLAVVDLHAADAVVTAGMATQADTGT